VSRSNKKSDDEIRVALDAVRANCDLEARRENDPVGIVHRYSKLEDQEMVGLVAALIAFGNVKTIRAKLQELLDRVGDHPARAADDEKKLFSNLRGWKHRVFLGEDLARLMIGARKIQKESGSLGDRFAEDLARTNDMQNALAAFCDAIRDRGRLNDGAKTGRRGPAHLLPNPRAGSGSKRLLLYMRWMVRPRDGIDFGIWNVDPAVLLMPVDVHIHKLSRNLGFTRQTSMSWKTTREITSALARLDPKDPVKYDFSLCHLGMLQRCPSRRDPKKCEGCGVKPICRHWAEP
jgi:uncharacterized protein (TIGR02757 family)